MPASTVKRSSSLRQTPGLGASPTRGAAATTRSFSDRLTGIPGVESAGLTMMPPISNEDGNWTQSIAVDGGPIEEESTRYVYFNAVSPRYFETLGMRFLQGRDFNIADSPANTRSSSSTRCWRSGSSQIRTQSDDESRSAEASGVATWKSSASSKMRRTNGSRNRLGASPTFLSRSTRRMKTCSPSSARLVARHRSPIASPARCGRSMLACR